MSTSTRNNTPPAAAPHDNPSGRSGPMSCNMGLTHGDIRGVVDVVNQEEAERNHSEDNGVRVLRVVTPGAPRFDSYGVSHGDSACVPSGDGHDSHGCHGVVGDRAPKTTGNAGGITDGVSFGMSGGSVKRGATTVVPAPTIGAPAGDADTHSGGRCDSGDVSTDGNMRGRAGCGGEDGAVIDVAPSPQHPVQCISDSGVLLFDVPVVLERRFISTPDNGDEETPEPNNTSAATSVDESVGEEAGAPLSRESRKDASNSNTCGDTYGVTTGGATSGADDEDGCFRVSGGEHGDCRG